LVLHNVNLTTTSVAQLKEASRQGLLRTQSAPIRPYNGHHADSK